MTSAELLPSERYYLSRSATDEPDHIQLETKIWKELNIYSVNEETDD
jgi:hypothetical protein